MSDATKNFSDANLLGAGTFGKVYMGLLLDGTVVAIKRRVGAPRQDFSRPAPLAPRRSSSTMAPQACADLKLLLAPLLLGPSPRPRSLAFDLIPPWISRPGILLFRQVTGDPMGEVRAVSGMHERKAEMARFANAFIALPGTNSIARSNSSTSEKI